jgi:hypothetical protein
MIRPVAFQGFEHTYWCVQWRFSCRSQTCHHVVNNVLWNDVKDVISLNRQLLLDVLRFGCVFNQWVLCWPHGPSLFR